MFTLTIDQEIIDRARQYRVEGWYENRISLCCPMALALNKHFGVEVGTYGWGFIDGGLDEGNSPFALHCLEAITVVNGFSRPPYKLEPVELVVVEWK